MENDPAARSKIEVFLLYPTIHALIAYRISHYLYINKLFFLARLISQISRFFTGIEIHPGAKIGKNLFIDHGFGVVIGQTSIIGNNVTIYHGVTLGANKNTKEKRHPTIEDNVIIGCHAVILGNIRVGKNAKIGANATVLHNVNENEIIKGPQAN